MCLPESREGNSYHCWDSAGWSLFMEEFGLNHHHCTHEQQNTMKQELATIYQQLGLIQAMDVF